MIASFEVILFKNLVVAAELKFSVLFYYFFFQGAGDKGHLFGAGSGSWGAFDKSRFGRR